MLRCTSACLLKKSWLAEPNVVGTSMLDFVNAPLRRTDILRLYKDFWKLIMLYPPSERTDLAFKLRTQFRSTKHQLGPKAVGRAYKKGLHQLHFHRTLMDSRSASESGLRGVQSRSNHSEQPETLTDYVWDDVRQRTQGSIPGLRTSPCTYELRQRFAKRRIGT
jgi:hypothetical protein